MRLLPLFILGITSLTLACAPAKFRKVAGSQAITTGGDGAVQGQKSDDATPDGTDDGKNLPDFPNVPPCFAPTSYGNDDDGDYPSQSGDPSQNPGQSAGQNGDPTQNPGQNPDTPPDGDGGYPGTPPGDTGDGDAGTPPGDTGDGDAGTPPGDTGDGDAGTPPGDTGDGTAGQPPAENPC